MSDKLMVTVQIPVKMYIKKYLIARYGVSHTLSKRSLIGTILFHLLDKNCPKTEVKFDDHTEKYDIQVSEYYFNMRGYYIGTKKKKYLSLFFEKIFIEDLYLFMDMAKANFNINSMQALRQFLSKYEITENDVNLDSLYRKYSRAKKTKKDSA